MRQAKPLAWNPPAPNPSNHFCLYVRAASPQDPITSLESGALGSNTRDSNNIAWRNLNIVDLGSSKTVTFLVRNIDRKEGNVDLTIEIPPKFLKIGKVNIQLEPGLDQRWRERGKLPKELSIEREYKVLRSSSSLMEHGSDVKVETGPMPREIVQRIYNVAKPEVTLQGLPLKGRQAVSVRITFGSAQKTRATYDVHILEKIDGKIVGGILYKVRTGYK